MTVGIHPKVALPALALALAGAALLIAGVVTADNTLTTWGGALLAASGVTGTVGYAAPAAGVTTRATANDDQLRDAGALADRQPDD